MTALAYIGFGANLGDRVSTWQTVQTRLHASVGRVVATSSLYETEPVGGPEQPAYLNAVIALETPLSAHDLLQSLLALEQSLGRVRDVRWGPRVVDLDLLLMEDQVITTPTLQLPHPRLTERRFVLIPLTEIAPTLRHPVTHQTMIELLNACPDTSAVISFSG